MHRNTPKMMSDIQGYLDTCKKWLVEQIEEETAEAGNTGFGCRIYTTCYYENVFVFSYPFHIESLCPRHAVGRMLIDKKSILGGTSYVPSADLIRKSYSGLDIGTLVRILEYLRG
jgi:hypothetical protein